MVRISVETQCKQQLTLNVILDWWSTDTKRKESKQNGRQARQGDMKQCW